MNYIFPIILRMLLQLKTGCTTFLQLETSDMISLAAVIISALSLLGALITYIIKSYSDYNKKIEEMRPNVFISYEKWTSYTIFNERMILKNYGKTTAWITSIKIEPELVNEGSANLLPNTFSNINNFPLAPGQELNTLIGTSGKENNTIKKVESRKFTIKYESEDRTRRYISEYIVNEKGYPVLLSQDKSKDIIEIRDAISKVSDELSVIKDKL